MMMINESINHINQQFLEWPK